MLKQPIVEKLAATRLFGMVEALKTQEQDPPARELSFLERFGLLVDQQWNWRENQALGRRLKNAKLRTPNACVEEINYRTAPGLDKSVIRSLTQQSARVGTHENIFVLGPTGVGKSFVAPWRRRHAAMVTRPYTHEPSRYSAIWQWLGQTAACEACSRDSAASMSWSSTTGPWPRCRKPNAVTSGRSVRIVIRCAP